MDSRDRHPPRIDRRAALALPAGLLGVAGACAGRRPRAEAAELDELFSDLEDRSGDYRPITAEEKRPRFARLGAALRAANQDALLIEPGATLDYLVDVRWGRSERLFALVVLADGTLFWLSPAFEAPRAERRIASSGAPQGPIVTWDEHEYAWEPLASALHARAVERIALEPEARAFVAERLAGAFGRERVQSGAEVVLALRGKKEAREIELLRGASELTQRAIAAVAERLRPGLTDAEVGRWMRHAQERLGLASTWVLPLLNADAALPHGSSTERVLAPGDVVLVDTGGGLHGYQSDITRTWVFAAEPPAEVERAWNAVRDAQKRGFEALRPGAPCAAADRAARASIEAAGYGAGYASFTHRLGHGIGVEGHEEPYLDGGNELPLRPGMTFSDEPGIYLPGRFGVRIEDIVCITVDGADHFGAWQRSPASPA